MSEAVKQLTEEEKKNREGKRTKITTKEIVSVGMFAAVLAVLSQISIPMPSGVPITMQTFAVALTGVVLAWKLGTASMIVYILLGAVGVPVFAGFSGGAQVLVNYTGGFIWGFIVMTLLCGVGVQMKNKAGGLFVGLAGLAVCHLFGTMQFMLVMKMGIVESFLLASAPYLVKDIISVVLGFVIGGQLRQRLLKAGLL
ncbi:MAG: biotin transporter BioY [Lachnospiraceae bacterium]|nr:biotin transporter BioY [Lachnospiraceae bacterium]